MDYPYPVEQVKQWKDQLLSGSSRTPIPAAQGNPGGNYVFDPFNPIAGEVYRNDWVDAGGVPVISGSSEQAAWQNNGIRPGTGPQGGGVSRATAPTPQMLAAWKALREAATGARTGGNAGSAAYQALMADLARISGSPPGAFSAQNLGVTFGPAGGGGVQDITQDELRRRAALSAL